MKLYINNLKKNYGEKTVLDIDELEIEKDKITGIIGPNGSGKSTLLNIISGLDKEYEGNVLYNDIKLNRQVALNMTYVFQKPYLFRRKVYDNIAYPLKLRKLSRDKEINQVNEIANRLEIEDLINKKAHLLSGGESQKVALARALIFKPKLLLLDEPTSNIDPESIKIMEREILRFNKETNATIVIVTHNLDQSQRICDNILYIQNGKVEI